MLLFITVEGVVFVNMEPKKVMQYVKAGFIVLNVGRHAFSLLWRRLFCKNKKQNTKMKKYKKQKGWHGFASAKRGVFKGTKMGHRVLRIIKEYYF